MKFIKKLNFNQYNPISNRFSVLPDDRIVTDTKVGMELPRGDQGNDRPSVNVNGVVRYNTVINEPEIYNGSTPGTGWEKIRTVRPAPITIQTLGPGDGILTDFGPLQYDDTTLYRDHTNPQNIFVYIENVPQIPVKNFTLVQKPGNEVWIRFTSPPPIDVTEPKFITVLLGVDGNFPPFPAQT